jgi:hypothetical protein
MTAMLPRLPIPAPPARHETLASYLTRLAALHGLKARELWDAVSTPIAGTTRRDVDPERLAAITGRPADRLARALPELRAPAPEWAAWRHQAQPRCPRCDVRHDGGEVHRLLPHHRYVCIEHRYWIGPPDAGQRATELYGPIADELVAAQQRHVRLVRRHGAAAAYDAVLTGFLICGHLWNEPHRGWQAVVDTWNGRAFWLIPQGRELVEFSASRVFAATYPEAVAVAALIVAPDWRSLAAGDETQQRVFMDEIARRLGRHDSYTPPHTGDAIAHWMKYDCWQPPSRPQTTFPDTRAHRSTRVEQPASASLDRHDRSATFFALKRRGGNTILHHRHIRSVLIRDWSRPMDGIQATISESANTFNPSERDASRLIRPAAAKLG